jgi:hypothetical protein
MLTGHRVPGLAGVNRTEASHRYRGIAVRVVDGSTEPLVGPHVERNRSRSRLAGKTPRRNHRDDTCQNPLSNA